MFAGENNSTKNCFRTPDVFQWFSGKNIEKQIVLQGFVAENIEKQMVLQGSEAKTIEKTMVFALQT